MKPIAARKQAVHAALAALLAAALAVPALAAEGRFTASNLLRVYPLPRAGNFEVISSRGAGPGQIWCAAAEYAQARTRPDFSRRMYISRPLSVSANEPPRKGVAFTLAPDADLLDGPTPNNSGLTLSVKQRGFNLTVNHANAMCGAFRDTPDCPLCP
jgi:hypothetical protein